MIETCEKKDSWVNQLIIVVDFCWAVKIPVGLEYKIIHKICNPVDMLQTCKYQRWLDIHRIFRLVQNNNNVTLNCMNNKHLYLHQPRHSSNCLQLTSTIRLVAVEQKNSVKQHNRPILKSVYPSVGIGSNKSWNNQPKSRTIITHTIFFLLDHRLWQLGRVWSSKRKRWCDKRWPTTVHRLICWLQNPTRFKPLIFCDILYI